MLVDVARVRHVVLALVDFLAENDDLLEQKDPPIAEDLLLGLRLLPGALVVHHLQGVLQQQLPLRRYLALHTLTQRRWIDIFSRHRLNPDTGICSSELPATTLPKNYYVINFRKKQKNG